jgi:hypothetical protein
MTWRGAAEALLCLTLGTAALLGLLLTLVGEFGMFRAVTIPAVLAWYVYDLSERCRGLEARVRALERQPAVRESLLDEREREGRG